jgi:predicted RNA binding protein YcfA (HicA-like mRNA interferase family)
MNKLPPVTGKQLVRVRVGFGFSVVRIRGSHNILKHQDGRQTVVPIHAGESIGPGLLAKILRDCDMTSEQLERAL